MEGRNEPGVCFPYTVSFTLLNGVLKKTAQIRVFNREVLLGARSDTVVSGGTGI